MSNVRLWIVLLALVSFAGGGAAGALAVATALRPAPAPGPFAEYERNLVRTFELSPERAGLLRVLLDGYQKEIGRIQSSHMADTLSAMEPDLTRVGRSYREQIRDKVLPPARRAAFDDPRFVSSWMPAR